VQEKKESFQKKKRQFAGISYMYRGLLRCAVCGLAITPGKHKGHVYYRCTQSKGHHNAKWLREEEITAQLAAVFKNLQFPQEVLQQITQTLGEVHKNKIAFRDEQLDKLAREQREVHAALDKLYEDKIIRQDYR
jgi:hypothetical protein